MGLALTTRVFTDWVEHRWESNDEKMFYAELESVTGIKREEMSWPVTLDDHLRVGSYTSYGVFSLFLLYLTDGDFEDDLTADDDIELTALNAFRSAYSPASVQLENVSQFLETGDCDTIFLPVRFDTPFTWQHSSIGSIPTATAVLENLADRLKFSLEDDYEEEGDQELWMPLATSRNISRLIYKFFTEHKDSCISFE